MNTNFRICFLFQINKHNKRKLILDEIWLHISIIMCNHFDSMLSNTNSLQYSNMFQALSFKRFFICLIYRIRKQKHIYKSIKNELCIMVLFLAFGIYGTLMQFMEIIISTISMSFFNTHLLNFHCKTPAIAKIHLKLSQ